MKTLLFLLISAVAFGQNAQNVIDNEIIVKFKTQLPSTKKAADHFLENSDLSKLHSEFNVLNYKTIHNKQSNSTIVIRLDSSESLENIISTYEKTGLFDYVEPNYSTIGSGVLNTTPNDAEYDNQWSLKNDGTFPLSPAVSGADIEMEPAWDIEQGDPEMIVAVIDTGLRLSHPEMFPRLWNNTNEVADGTDTDNNGFVDDLFAGWDFINDDNNPTDDHGHGTIVAGIALATGNNSIGFAGVNWNSQIMICKALDQNNSGSYAAMAGAIYYAVDNGAKVINMSIGGSGLSNTLTNAIDYCYDNNVVLVASMMNFNNDVTYYPAGYNRTIAVGSTDPDDTRSNPFFWSDNSGSNFGNHIDVVAPGNYMYGLNHTSDNFYGSYWGGTSQATPLVAGVVSLLFAQNPNLTFDDIRTILWETSEDQVGDPAEDTNGFDVYYGYGRLNANNALNHELIILGNTAITTNAISIHPNPVKANSELRVSDIPNGDYSISLSNAMGQLVQSTKARSSNSNFNIPITRLNAGIYFITIADTNKNKVTVKKLIVE